MLCAVVVYHRVVPEEEGGDREEITVNLYRVDCLRLRGLMRVADKKKGKKRTKKEIQFPERQGRRAYGTKKRQTAGNSVLNKWH